jgi:hypothetical protein
MDAARKDGAMTALELGPAAQKSALRFFLGKYFSVLGGDFAPPQYVNLGAAYG